MKELPTIYTFFSNKIMIMRKFWFYVSWPKDKLPTTYVLNVLDHSEVTSVVGKLTFGQKMQNPLKLPTNNSDKKSSDDDDDNDVSGKTRLPYS